MSNRSIKAFRKEEKTRLKDAKAAALKAAVIVAKKKGFGGFTRTCIATEAGIAEASVSNYLGTMTNVKRAVMRVAVREQILCIVAAGVALRHRTALGASDELKERASQALLGG